jgi:ribosomal protein S18 acetylase RimI-like enzyme
MLSNAITTVRVSTEAERRDAVEVLRDIYREEKHWVQDEETVFPSADLADETIAWFLVRVGKQPAGVVRVCYDPPLETYATYGFQPLQLDLDIEAFVRENRLAEIGRFAVRRRYRNRLSVAAALMRAATAETVRREYTHYITDVFEGEVNSPYHFHTSVIGFQPVATHSTGELNCPYRRITLVLNLKEAYQRLRQTKRQVHAFLTRGWDEALHRRMIS